MHDLIDLAIGTHGGLARWERLSRVSAMFKPGGLGLILRGQEAFTKSPTRVTIDTREQRTRFEPFITEGRRAVFEPDRTAVEGCQGNLLEELRNPRASFGDGGTTDPWSGAQLAYFAGYAMWTYLTLPFSLVKPGFVFEETEPYVEDGDTWRAVNIVFPASLVTHCAEQTLYIDQRGLIRRHDYSVDISNGAKAAHYLYDHREFEGFVFPTRRRIYPRGEDRTPQTDIVVFSADMSDYKLSV
jgi:hypothetical protein